MENKTSQGYQKNNRFFNPYQKYLKRHLLNMLLWKLGYYNEPKKRAPPPKDFKYPINIKFEKTTRSCTWVNHCTFLINSNKINILTDPIFNNYCSPLPIPALKRKHDLKFQINDLPKIDYVLISHNHYDHLDKNSVKQLNQMFPDIKWIVPLKLSKWFKRFKIQNVFELGWWEEKRFNDILRITAVPSQHFSGRGVFSMNKTFWNGYVVEFLEDQKRFYFVGDTGYNQFDFSEIGKKLGPMDLSLIPIGTYCPRPFMQAVHVDPSEAVAIHKDVKSSFSIGMHWKTFKLSDEPLDLPPYDLYLALKNAEISFDKFIAIEPGEQVDW